jgi:hypothetical protein
MAFDEFTIHRLEKVVSTFVDKRRPPPLIRKDLDLGFKIKGQSIELFEIRPRWQHPEEIMECPVAKTTYVKTQGVWKIYWMRQDLKWHYYDPLPEVDTIEKFLLEVDSDPYHCFWG